ncbi:hypothetical protein BHU62_07770 [Serratia marcescens]|uniref:Uncharacterized protein n=1 Tax=Serratia marcescens TaxID=615 RepID=A0A1Q4P2L1_SERMA|nr:hypothetical protein [Serratia marcescens]OKB67378.1 hypothetical protein BHU62_07770 [Serratia marcescens]
MVIKSTKRQVTKPASYALKVYKFGMEGVDTVKIYTSEQIDRITPRGKPITASREEVIAVLKLAAKQVNASSSPDAETLGCVRQRQAFN